ncbi:MAG TPA: anthranilate synthase component I [Chthoniobacterales bacterium]|jgi:anthranilate synthase component 1|nr:anthranilate synthase component I [Chthoniobacterales bacterium]
MRRGLEHSISPSRHEFHELAKRGNLVPLVVDLVADVETPVSAFAKIDNGEPCFLFESAERNEELGRFSFIGFDPLAIFNSVDCKQDPLSALQQTLARFQFVPPADVPHFIGGAVGYIGYDVVRFFEPTVPIHPRDDLKIPEMIFMIPRMLLVFDHRFRKLQVICNAHINAENSVDQAYDNAIAALEKVMTLLEQQRALPAIDAKPPANLPSPASNTSRTEFEAMVTAAKEHIAAGDIFQVVLSQRFETDFKGHALDLYRALRFGNPSPYMFCLRFDPNFVVLGSSPEVHLRVRDQIAQLRPIAGTYPRGKDSAEDERLARELIVDPKERAEHVMLIDLGRNDLGRVAEFGSVKVTEQMAIERYSHVMHIVSHIVARLSEGKNAFDAIRATFPAGTVSGAPKIRAMQIIAELEKARRGFYAGIVGYFGFDGSHDSCIAIRSIVLKNGKAYLQTGAGIVADSDPAREFDECMNKAKAMLAAIARTESMSTSKRKQ